MAFDQNGAEFLDQLKPFLRGLLAWLQEESNEPEHPAVEGFDEQPETAQAQAQPVRTRTTTVVDYQPQVATDPPVSQAQRGAMHAAAQGNSNIGIPQSVGREFANADPGGKLPEKKGQDNGGGDLTGRFALSPDGNHIIDNHTGISHSIDDVMRIVFSGGSNDASVAGATPNTVNVARPATAKATWKMPPINVRQQGSAQNAPTTTQAASAGQWASPKFPEKREDRLGDGAGGAALGRLLQYASGEGSARDAGGLAGVVETAGNIAHGAAKGVEYANKATSPERMA
jgi:hypothetical protein